MRKSQLLILISIVILLQNSVFALGFSYSGEINPSLKYQPSDGTLLELPFRISNIDLNIYHGNFELQSKVALETRWEDLDETKIQLRELYIHWYPRFGEVKIGKIIHAWGYADQNNPTDNLNPYNFYYLFDTGIERKIGSLSGSISVNLGNMNVEGIFIAEHNSNKLPYNENDFPIEINEPPKDAMLELENPYEYGIRLKHNVFDFDYSISYFHCYDRSPTILGGVLTMPLYNFGYRKNDMIGLDFVKFFGDFTIRTESAYFFTTNQYNKSNFSSKFEQDVQYLQYVIQLEYNTPIDVKLTTQFMGNYIVLADGSGFDMNNMIYSTDLKNIFVPGVGVPFLSFMDRGISFGANVFFFDDRLELETFTLFNIEQFDEYSGQMIALNSSYYFLQNFEVELNYLWIVGNDDENNFLTKMEDFSHLSVGLKYNF